MARFRVIAHIDAPVDVVFRLLADWEGSAQWMVDATTVKVLGAQREGVGTRVRAVTTIAGISLTDEMTVVEWIPNRRIEVSHDGRVIRGIAWFALAADHGGTRLEWCEDLEPPLGPLGEIGALLLRRPIERLLRRSTVRLRAKAEAEARSSRSTRKRGTRQSKRQKGRSTSGGSGDHRADKPTRARGARAVREGVPRRRGGA